MILINFNSLELFSFERFLTNNYNQPWYRVFFKSTVPLLILNFKILQKLKTFWQWKHFFSLKIFKIWKRSASIGGIWSWKCLKLTDFARGLNFREQSVGSARDHVVPANFVSPSASQHKGIPSFENYINRLDHVQFEQVRNRTRDCRTIKFIL